MLPFSVPHALFPAEHHFLNLGGARIHYATAGSGETVLLLHGNPSWSFLYRKIIAGLADEFRCVAPDFPGYGMSSAAHSFLPREHSEMLERFADELGLTDLTLMVQDWGGPIGLGFAARRPELIRRLIIGNTWAWPLDRELRVRAFSWLIGGPIGRTLTRQFNFVPEVFFRRGFAQPLAPEVRDLYLAPWRDPRRRTPAVIAPRQLIAASEYASQVEAGLHTLAGKPALIVWGRRTSRSGRPSGSGSKQPSPATRPSSTPMPRTSCKKTSATASPNTSRPSARTPQLAKPPAARYRAPARHPPRMPTAQPTARTPNPAARAP